VWRIVLRAALEQRHPAGEVSLDEVDPVFLEPERDLELAAAVRALPPRRRLAVFLRYFADLPYRTIAEVLEIDEGTVAATLAQARQALAVILDEEGVRP
jgi:RNA polymerase sigma-70 factor (ECF subfamily)